MAFITKVLHFHHASMNIMHHTHLNVATFRYRETNPHKYESLCYVFIEDIESSTTEVAMSWMSFAFSLCHNYIKLSNNISKYQSYQRLTFSFKANLYNILLITYQ